MPRFLNVNKKSSLPHHNIDKNAQEEEGQLESEAHLLLTKHEVVELLLQNLVGVVDQELLVEVLGEHFEPEYVQQPDEPVQMLSHRY